MSAYGALAAWYDALTRDVDYAAFADFYEQCFQQGRGACHTLLDFCCGTGTLTRLMAARGYEMIATDGSPDMLMQAQAHNADLPADAVQPLLLCQEAAQLDLYGTVDAAYCSLDGIDYLPPEELITKLEDNIFMMDQLTTILDEDGADAIIPQVMRGLEPETVLRHPMAYRCACSRARVEQALRQCGVQELQDMIADGKDTQVHCQFCDAEYVFTPAQLQTLLDAENADAAAD